MRTKARRLLASFTAAAMAFMVALPEIEASAASADTGVALNAENFPDEVFRQYISDDWDLDSNGLLSGNEIELVQGIQLENKGVQSLKGIEYFTNLERLSCNGNQLTTLDVSKNTKLTDLLCHENLLTVLDVSKNTALVFLECSGNKLTALDVSNNTALTTLYCSENQLTTLDVSKNTVLTNLGCNRNQLTVLDVNTALDILSCSENELTALDLSNNTALTGLYCLGNQLTTLDLNKNTALDILECSDNKLTALDVSNNTALTSLGCGYNQLTTLDVSKNTKLTDLRCSDNLLTVLDVSKNTALDSLSCRRNKLTALDLSNNPLLTDLNCDQNVYNIGGTCGTYDLKKLPVGFDLTKASNWRGAIVEGDKLTELNNGDSITYDYDCGNNQTVEFALRYEGAGHYYDEGVITKEPTEQTEGEKTYTCQNCGTIKTEVIGKLEPPTTIPMVIQNGWYEDNYVAGSITSKIKDFSEIGSVKINVTSNKNTSIIFFSTGSASNSVYKPIDAGEATDIEIAGINISTEDILQSSFFYFGVGCNVTTYPSERNPKVTFNSLTYLDKEGNVIASGNIGVTAISSCYVRSDDIIGWNIEKAAQIEKVVVNVDGNFLNHNPNAMFISLGSVKKEIGYNFDGDTQMDYSSTDIMLKSQKNNDIEIELGEKKLSDSFEMEIHNNSSGSVTVNSIKFLDSENNVVYQLGTTSEVPTEPDAPDEPVIPDVPVEPIPDDGKVIVETPEIGEGAPETKIENPESVKSAVGLTPEEKTAVENGADVKITLSVEKADGKLTPEEKEEIENKAPEGFEVGAYLDIKMDKQIGNLVKKAITELLNKVEITVVVPADLINTDENTTREYVIIHMHNGTTEIINGRFDPVNNTLTFPTDKFSTYAIAYKDTPKAVDPEPVPVPEPVYSVTVNGSANVTGAATAGSEMTVKMPIGFVARVYNGNTLIATICDSGKFTMPAGNVVVNVTDESGAGMMAYVAPNTYIFSYDSNMKLIKTSRSKKGIAGTGEMTVDLGAAYAGRTVTLYSGKKSTSEKITETVLDSRGRATFTVKGAKNYTLVVED